jgi:hypothetical protein
MYAWILKLRYIESHLQIVQYFLAQELFSVGSSSAGYLYGASNLLFAYVTVDAAPRIPFNPVKTCVGGSLADCEALLASYTLEYQPVPGVAEWRCDFETVLTEYLQLCD